MNKILIIHDRFQFRGGAERLVLDLANILHADIVTEFWTETTYPRSEVPHGLTVLDTSEPHMMVFRYFRAQWNFWWKTRKLIQKYDTIIFSGNNCLAAALRPLSQKQTIYYCHTPVRYVYDLLAMRRKAESSLLKRIFYYDIGKYLIRFFYRLGLARMKTVVTNSKNVQDRLVRFCHTQSLVVYPPIHTERFAWKGQQDFYLSYARLDALKRVDDIVRAFQKMPDKKLVIASGGEDAEHVAELAKGFPNIKLVGWVEDEQLKDLVGNCLATIYIPVHEDFGMTPVESMAAGKPCIGVNDGGLCETIIPEKTGILIPKTYQIEDIIKAVQSMTPERAMLMRADCEEQAEHFSLERFAKNIHALIYTKDKTHIAIDASRSIESVQKTGVEVVSDALLTNLERMRPDTINLTFYTPKMISWLPKNLQQIISHHKFWTILGLSFAMLRDKPHVLFVPVHALPFFCPKKTIRVIHDVSFLRTPEAYCLRERLYMRMDLLRAKYICSDVIVPTEAVKNDLIHLLHWPQEKIVVTGWGIPEIKTTLHNPSKEQTNPFILFIGRIEEKKNVANLIRAFALFHKTHPHWKLILAGKPGYGFEQIIPLLETPGVEHLGYVSEEKKSELLYSASMLALISYEEGFAFPMLEAFQAHIPVIASAIPTLMEIGEDAAIFADPNDIATLASNMKRVADDELLREQLVTRGSEKLKKYSWEKVTEQILKILLKK